MHVNIGAGLYRNPARCPDMVSTFYPEMPAPEITDIDELRSYVWGLAMACPVGPSNPEGCPLHEIRKRSLAERHRWLIALGNDEMKRIVASHCACLDAKLLLDGG